MVDSKPKRGGAREGSGRPSLFAGQEKKKITLSLTSKVVEMLTEEAEERGISRSDLVNTLIVENIKNNQR